MRPTRRNAAWSESDDTADGDGGDEARAWASASSGSVSSGTPTIQAPPPGDYPSWFADDAAPAGAPAAPSPLLLDVHPPPPVMAEDTEEAEAEGVVPAPATAVPIETGPATAPAKTTGPAVVTASSGWCCVCM